MMRRTLSALALSSVAAATAVWVSCSGPPEVDGTVGQQSEAVIGKAPVVCPPPDGTRPDPTLVNVDPFVLTRFPLDRVLKQLITIQGVAQTTNALYSQLWDTTDKAPGSFPTDPHCDDVGAINGFKVACPAPDAALKKGVPADFSPVALVNRFDLAPANGAHCGEYRIIYARTGNSTGSFTGRDFIIFEAALPNPNPKCGIEACRPVVKFWESLAAFNPAVIADQTALANALDDFYFKGLKGFDPVVHPNHYGAQGGGGYGAAGFGQIRLNMFFQFQRWRLRELHLVPVSPLLGPKLQMLPVTVKNNAFPDLYNALSPEPRALPFEGVFPPETANLATDNVNTIGMNIVDKYNAGESNSQIIGGLCGPPPAQNDNDQTCVNLGSPPNAFTGAIGGQLAGIGRLDLTPGNVFDRSTTQTCAGCHQISNSVNLGGAGGHPTLIWPNSRGFVHFDENSFLSPALWCQFLPFRKNILDTFFASPPVACPLAAPKGQALVIDPKAGGTINPADIERAKSSVSGKPFPSVN